jgi:hypothetical protein
MLGLASTRVLSSAKYDKPWPPNSNTVATLWSRKTAGIGLATRATSDREEADDTEGVEVALFSVELV